MKKLSLALVAMLPLAACQTLPPAADGVSPARLTEARALPWPEGRRYVVDPAASELRLVVRADGPMARFGHPHVIGGPAIGGEIALAEPFHESALRLSITVNELRVDDPDWRVAEGFEPDMDEDAIAGTRRNLLSAELLDAESHPEIRIESVAISGPDWQPDIEALVTVAGETRQLTVPVTLTIEAESLTAAGRFVIRQSDFGLKPFAAAGGALRVADEILIRFRIEAETAR